MSNLRKVLYNCLRFVSLENLYDTRTTCSGRCVYGTFTKVEMNQFKMGRGHLRTSCTHEYTNTYKEQNFIRIAAVKWCLVSK